MHPIPADIRSAVSRRQEKRRLASVSFSRIQFFGSHRSTAQHQTYRASGQATRVMTDPNRQSLFLGRSRNKIQNVVRAFRTNPRANWAMNATAGHSAHGIVAPNRCQFDIQVRNRNCFFGNHLRPRSFGPWPQTAERRQGGHLRFPPKGENGITVKQMLILVKPLNLIGRFYLL